MTGAAIQEQDGNYQEGKKWQQRVTMLKRFYSHPVLITLKLQHWNMSILFTLYKKEAVMTHPTTLQQAEEIFSKLL